MEYEITAQVGTRDCPISVLAKHCFMSILQFLFCYFIIISSYINT